MKHLAFFCICGCAAVADASFPSLLPDVEPGGISPAYSGAEWRITAHSQRYDDLRMEKRWFTVEWNGAQERRARLDALKRRTDMQVVEVESPDELTASAIAERAKAAGVHLYAPPGKAVVCAAEGYVLVQAQEAGMMPLDFGKAATVEDALTGKVVGEGPVVNVDFKLGETRLFKVK